MTTLRATPPLTDRLRRSKLVWLALAALLAGAACTPADPTKELAASEVEAYWVVDSVVGTTQYLAPAVRLRVKNVGTHTRRPVEATATFRRVGEKDTWGSGFARVTAPGKALAPGESAMIVMTSDSRYYLVGTAEQMFEHKLFKDATVTVFLRLSGSSWTQFADVRVERHIGAKSVQEFAPPLTPEPTPRKKG
jgi:hypothetical protein